MTNRPPTTEAAPGWLSRLSLPNPIWPWLLLSAATVVFVIQFVPRFYLASMDTETTFVPVFYQDVMVAHHSAANWAWGGVSALFPDIMVFFGLNYLVGDGAKALQLLQMCFFAGWLGATIALVAETNRPNKLSLVSLLLLLWIGLVCNFGFPNDASLNIIRSLLQPVYHSGTGIMAAICLVLLLHQLQHGWGIGFWWLLVLAFLGSASDTLFDAIFIGPALVTLVLLAAAFWDRWRWCLALVGNLAVAGAAGYFSAQRLFPPTLATGYYLQPSWGHVQSAMASITAEVGRSEHRLFAFVMILDALTVLGGLGGLLFFCFSKRRKAISPLVFSLMIFCSCSVAANWIAVVVTGDYVDMNANRYTTIALLIPLFILAFGLHAIILWRPWLEMVLAVIAAAFAFTSGFCPQPHSSGYDGVSGDIPRLKQLMQETNSQSCLGCYWCANIVTFLSHGEVPVRSLTNDAKIYGWCNSLEWFGKGHPVADWPRFRLIYGPDHGYSQVFGNPDKVVSLPSGAEVWVYSEAHSIRYNEYFDVLSNALLDDGRTLVINPSAMPGGCRIDGHARYANQGDAESWIQWGPYLELEPGNYRVKVHYNLPVLPAPGQEATYDVMVHQGDDMHSINGRPLPSLTTEPQVFMDNFSVTEPHCQYEMRLYYHGSGAIRVDSLELTFLGKPGQLQ